MFFGSSNGKKVEEEHEFNDSTERIFVKEPAKMQTQRATLR